MLTKRPRLKKILLALVLLLVIIQVFCINKEMPETDPSRDFMTLTNAPADIASILNASCYDCHSNSTVYPWYTNISPVSWWIRHHVNEGREELNFSEWGAYSSRRKDHKLKEAVEQVEAGEMPMSSYLWVHKNAELNAEQKEKLNAFFNSLRTNESDQPRKE
jgi:hypothetical protein